MDFNGMKQFLKDYVGNKYGIKQNADEPEAYQINQVFSDNFSDTDYLYVGFSAFTADDGQQWSILESIDGVEAFYNLQSSDNVYTLGGASTNNGQHLALFNECTRLAGGSTIVWQFIGYRMRIK